MAAAAACGAQLRELVTQDCGNGAAWTISVLEAVTKPRTWRASGSSVRADTRGAAGSADGGRSRSVAARRIRRRRPSGKATAMNRGPRAQASDRTAKRWPDRGWRGSVTVIVEISRSAAVADCGVRLARRRHGAARPATPPRRRRADRGLQLPATPARRADARTRPLQSHHHPADTGINPAPPRPATEKCIRPTWAMTGETGEFLNGTFEENSGSVSV